jgi:2-keto-4-pentenoate hydratase/2-oxohepta-3-ene-1,7-dioic acid hydratase in catechol pathway
MARWVRFDQGNGPQFGTIEGETIAIHRGDMFEAPEPTGETARLDSVKLLIPCVPANMVCLWNNFAANAAKQNLVRPAEPLWFLKSPSSYLAHGEPLKRPASYPGKIVYEGEIGIVIGRRCSHVSEAEAPDHIFGYTCVNDVTAIELITKDASFAQWTRAKSFDSFGVFGPAIATGLDPMALSIRTVLNGAERQNYPVSDMFFPPAQLVSLISRDITLQPGDVIACGTSVGVGVISKAENTVDVSIEGIGTLTNTLTQTLPAEVAKS